MRAIIYVGPTLPRSTVESLFPAAEVRGPAARGGALPASTTASHLLSAARGVAGTPPSTLVREAPGTT